MEGLRHLAKASFEDYDNGLFQEHPSHDHYLVNVNLFAGGETTYELARARPHQIIPALRGYERKAEAPGVRASLRLVGLTSDFTWKEGIGLGREHFFRLLEHFHIDPCLLQLIRYHSFGVHWFEHGDGGITFYVSSVLHELIWSFEPGERPTTSGILILRFHRLQGRDAIFRAFEEILALYRHEIDGPLCLAFVALVQITSCLEALVYSELRSVRDLERGTGHGVHGHPVRPPSLLELSRRIDAHRVQLSDEERHIGIALSLVSLLDGKERWWVDLQGGEALKSSLERQIARSDGFHAAVPPIRRRIESTGMAIKYINDRVSSQSSVVFALLSHDDAEVGRDIADKAGKDNASMRTIAIVTMAFLPATFFAALFAMPLFDWQGPTVGVYRNFWVYVVCTVPTTILVFGVWALAVLPSFGKAEKRENDSEGRY